LERKIGHTGVTVDWDGKPRKLVHQPESEVKRFRLGAPKSSPYQKDVGPEVLSRGRPLHHIVASGGEKGTVGEERISGREKNGELEKPL